MDSELNEDKVILANNGKVPLANIWNNNSSWNHRREPFVYVQVTMPYVLQSLEGVRRLWGRIQQKKLAKTSFLKAF